MGAERAFVRTSVIALMQAPIGAHKVKFLSPERLGNPQQVVEPLS
jgi:hypothetical protein